VPRSFQSALRKGHDAERRWVDSMRDGGLAVGHGKKLVIAKSDPRTIHVETPDAVALFSVEVKERSISFSTPEDYPYDTVFVDDCRGLSKERYRNLVYVYLSRPTGAWVWLTMLDRNNEWKEEVTHDRGRGHALPVLVCPKRFLRPAEQLIDLVFPHAYLDLVDGSTDWLVSGGGETERRDSYSAKANPNAGGRDSKAQAKGRKHMG